MCHPIRVTLLKFRPLYSQSSCENATPSSGTFLLASYKEVTPRGLNTRFTVPHGTLNYDKVTQIINSNHTIYMIT